MKLVNKDIKLPEGDFSCEMQIWKAKNDKKTLLKIYNNWVGLSDLIEKNGGRRINIPELLSEAIYCLHFDAGRITKSISGANSSFDCYNIDEELRIQVKASSVDEDLTSFGPKSVWDKLYFIHFFPNGKYDKYYKIYEIPNNLIFNHKVNSNQTFLDQQNLKRRPRFSIIKDIIKKNKIQYTVYDKLG